MQTNDHPLIQRKPFRRSLLHCGMLSTVLAYLLVGWGCSHFQSVPVTLKEVKDYAVGRQQSFSHPIDAVLRSAVYNLKHIGFTILKIESTQSTGMVHGAYGGASVKLFMESITPYLTKVASKIHRRQAFREFSSEDELFNRIRVTLSDSKTPIWERITAGMAKIHASPDGSSDVIGYAGNGGKLKRVANHGKWAKVRLESKALGYIHSRHLLPSG